MKRIGSEPLPKMPAAISDVPVLVHHCSDEKTLTAAAGHLSRDDNGKLARPAAHFFPCLQCLYPIRTSFVGVACLGRSNIFWEVFSHVEVTKAFWKLGQAVPVRMLRGTRLWASGVHDGPEAIRRSSGEVIIDG